MKKKAVVIGGGFSGLTAAYYLARLGCSVTLHEKSDRLGGLIGTDELAGGYAEWAANGLLNSLEVERLFEDLNIQKAKTGMHFKKKYIYRDGIRRWPLSFLETLFLVPKIFAFIFFRRLFKPKGNESVQAWGERVWSKSLTDYLLVPALQGIYAGDSRELLAGLIFGRFFEKKEKTNKPKQIGTVSPAGGMRVLMKALEEKLHHLGVEIHLGSEIRPQPDDLENFYIVATSAKAASRILQASAPELSEELANVQMHPLVSASVVKPRVQKHGQGFGCLFPADQGFRAQGVLFNDGLFQTNTETVTERWILGGANDQEITQLDDEALIDEIKKDHLKLFGEELDIRAYHIKRWPVAIPHYDGAIAKVLKKVNQNASTKESTNVFLIGNYMGDIGLSRILLKNTQLAREWSKE